MKPTVKRVGQAYLLHVSSIGPLIIQYVADSKWCAVCASL